MHTLSGRRFEIGTEFAPTVADIAVSLARLPRWGGATVKGKDWCVLHHSYAAGLVAQDRGCHPESILYALLHDMEEMATGDIPKPFKTHGQSELGAQLQRWLYSRTIGLQFPDEFDQAVVKTIDDELKFAELVCFCHPNSWWDPYFHQKFLDFAIARDPDPQTMGVVDRVWEVAETDEDKLIDLFTEWVEDLIEDCRHAI